MKSIKAILASRVFHSALGMAVSGILIGVLVYALDWPEVWRHLKSAHLWVLIPSLLLLWCHYWLRAWRWKYLLPPTDTVQWQRMFDSIMVGNFATYILPLRAGEFVRPYLLTRYSPHSFSTCFISVVVERFFDLSIVLLSFAVMVVYVPGVPDWVNKGALLLSVLALGILVFISLGALFPAQIERLLTVLLKPFPAKLSGFVQRFARDLLRGALVLRSFSNIVRITALSLAVWGSCYLLFYLFFFFFDIPPSLWMAVAIAVIVALAVAAPSAPGFIGIYQAGCIAGFQLFGVSEELAGAYSILTHALQFVLFILYGIYFLLSSGLSFKELRRAGAPHPTE